MGCVEVGKIGLVLLQDGTAKVEIGMIGLVLLQGGTAKVSDVTDLGSLANFASLDFITKLSEVRPAACDFTGELGFLIFYLVNFQM